MNYKGYIDGRHHRQQYTEQCIRMHPRNVRYSQCRAFPGALAAGQHWAGRRVSRWLVPAISAVAARAGVGQGGRRDDVVPGPWCKMDP